MYSDTVPHEVPAGLLDCFDGAFTGAPDGGWAAPGRVNLIGEHTDYNDGLVLPIALPQRTWALARRRADDLVRMVSLDLPGEPVLVSLAEVRAGHPAGWAAYAAGSVWALGAGGLDLAVASTVPMGAGLSSSAALEAAVAAAASDLFGLGLLADDAGRSRLAQACRRAENVVAQAPTGGMDQAASLRCRPAHALLLDCRDGSVTHVPIDLAAHGLTLLVINTRAEHALVDGQYGARRAQCEAAAAELGVPSLRSATIESVAGLADPVIRARAQHVVSEIERVRQVVAALAADDFVEVGRLFVASHASLRDDFEVTVRELDLAVDASLAAGALGARMTGGGFGGSAIALVAADRLEQTRAGVDEAFAAAGLACARVFCGGALGRRGQGLLGSPRLGSPRLGRPVSARRREAAGAGQAGRDANLSRTCWHA